MKARREVILCCGAACTPQLLLLSGIGPRKSAEDFRIPCIKDLPAAGATLSDHYSILIMLEILAKETFHILETLWIVWHLLLWLFFGKGHLSLHAIPLTICARSDKIDQKTMKVIQRKNQKGHDTTDSPLSCNVPDIEVMIIPYNSFERAVQRRALASLYITLVQPRSSGQIEPASANPFAQSRISYPMFTNKHDIISARLAVRFTMRLAEGFQRSGYPYPAKVLFAPGQDLIVLGEWEKTAPSAYIPAELPAASSVCGMPQSSIRPGTHRASGGSRTYEPSTWRSITNQEIDDYMRRVAHTTLHVSGTCPMSNSEVSGVVDQSLCVHGFSNLRIADTSVFTKIPSCHIMAPVMAVAERCANIVKATWR